MELAERAYDLWGRILEAQMDYLAQYSPPLNRQKSHKLVKPIFEYTGDDIAYGEGQPPEIDLNERVIDRAGRSIDLHERLNEYMGQAKVAEYLFNLALEKADTLPDASKFNAPAEEQPAPQEEPSKPKKPIKRFDNTLLGDEEMAERTETLIDEMRINLRGTGETDEIARAEAQKREAQKREFMAKSTVVHVKHGVKELKKTTRHRFILGQEESDQVVLWLGQASGPRQAPHRQSADDRINFACKMINLGRLDEKMEIDDAAVWDHVQEAVEQGLITDAEDPELTAQGFQYVQELLQTDQVKDRQAHIFSDTISSNK